MTKITAILLTSSVLFVLFAFTLGHKLFIVTSSSMEPNLSAGSLLYIHQSDGYKTGDIITFRTADNQITTHRIIDFENDTYLTRGDANTVSDGEIVYRENILGRQTVAIPHIGSAFLLIKKMWAIES